MENAKTIVSGTRVHRPLLDETVTTEDWEKAREELNETPDTRAAVLARLKELLAEEKDFLPRTDDNYLLRFLRARKFDLERSYKLLREHYWFRAMYPDVFPAPSAVEKVLKANIFNYLPHRDHLGRAIFLVKMSNWKSEEVSYDSFVAAGNLMSEYVLDNPVTQINGYIGIWDFSGFTLQQFIPFISPRNRRLLKELMQDRFPGRFKMAYCINCHSLVHTAWKIFYRILREKFRNRVKILTGDMKILHQYVDPSILPIEYGGSMPNWPCTEMAERVLKKEQHFNYNRKFGFAIQDGQKLND